jgi:hypothetical protein
VVPKLSLGAGLLGFTNNYAPVTIAPDGTAYVGVLGGVTMLRDAPSAPWAGGTPGAADRSGPAASRGR